MDFLTSMRISSSGMAAQRVRMDTTASNIANAETTRSPEGGPYRRKDVVFGAIPENEKFGEILDGKMDENFQRVQVMDVMSDEKAPRLVHRPNHPDANEEGYVAMPNVNPTEEMVNMINATRAYEANVTAFNASKHMAMKALEIGKQ